MKKQNKLGTYLAVTAGAGCAASLASGATQVVELSQLDPVLGVNLSFPNSTGDTAADILIPDSTNGFLQRTSGFFYSDNPGVAGADPDFARGYSGAADFPAEQDSYAVWRFGTATGGGFQEGLNWVAMRDSAGNYGWLSFTLSGLVGNPDDPVTSFGHFVYDPTVTSPADAINLSQAIAATPVPEPSGLALLALGSVGLAARRKRKAA